MHGIPYRFDCWGDPDAHLLLLENSMVKLSQLWLTVPYIRATFWYVVVIECTVYMPSLRTIRVRILLTWTSSWTGTTSDNSLIQCKFIRNGIQNASVIYSPVSCCKTFYSFGPRSRHRSSQLGGSATCAKSLSSQEQCNCFLCIGIVLHGRFGPTM